MLALRVEKRRSKLLSVIKQSVKNFMTRFSVIKVGDKFDHIFIFYTKSLGYICFHMPSSQIGWFLFCSPDAKPSTSTFYRGYDKGERIRAMIRKSYVGHNWIYRMNKMKAPRYEIEKAMNNVTRLTVDIEKCFERYDLF